MGNLINHQPNRELLSHLNNFHIKLLTYDEHKQFEKFRINSMDKLNSATLYTLYKYQKPDDLYESDFILCKSDSIDDIIANTLSGHESVSYIWYAGVRCPQLSIKCFLSNKISRDELSLVEMHILETVKSCKTLRQYNNVKNQDDISQFTRSDLIDGIMDNFVYYPPIKSLLLTCIIDYYNVIPDVRLHIFNIYVRMLYDF